MREDENIKTVPRKKRVNFPGLLAPHQNITADQNRRNGVVYLTFLATLTRTELFSSETQ